MQANLHMGKVIDVIDDCHKAGNQNMFLFLYKLFSFLVIKV